MTGFNSTGLSWRKRYFGKMAVQKLMQHGNLLGPIVSHRHDRDDRRTQPHTMFEKNRQSSHRAAISRSQCWPHRKPCSSISKTRRWIPSQCWGTTPSPLPSNIRLFIPKRDFLLTHKQEPRPAIPLLQLRLLPIPWKRGFRKWRTNTKIPRL